MQNLIVTLPQPSNNKFVTIGVYLAVTVFKLITVLKLIEILLADYTKKVRIRKNAIKAYSGVMIFMSFKASNRSMGKGLINTHHDCYGALGRSTMTLLNHDVALAGPWVHGDPLGLL